MFSFKRSLNNRWVKYYQNSNWPIIVDVASVFTVIALLILFLSLYFYNPRIIINDDYQIIDKEEFPVYILDLDNPPLNSEFSFIDAHIDAQKLSSELIIKLKNNSPQVIKDLRIKISSLENNLLITNLAIKTGFSDLELAENNELRIARIEADAEKEFILGVNWSNLNFAGKDANLKTDIEYVVAGQVVKKTLNLKSPRVESRIEAQASALYTSHDGDKLGLGPIPPIEKLPTNYWLFFEIKNQGDIKDFVMSARLAKNVSLTERYSLLSGDFNYDEENSLAIWKIEKIMAASDKLVLGLEVQLIPDASQVDTNPNLLDNINYFAKDAISGRELRGSLETLNTTLVHDKFNNNLGTVKSFSEY